MAGYGPQTTRTPSGGGRADVGMALGHAGGRRIWRSYEPVARGCAGRRPCRRDGCHRALSGSGWSGGVPVPVWREDQERVVGLKGRFLSRRRPRVDHGPDQAPALEPRSRAPASTVARRSKTGEAATAAPARANRLRQSGQSPSAGPHDYSMNYARTKARRQGLDRGTPRRDRLHDGDPPPPAHRHDRPDRRG